MSIVIAHAYSMNYVTQRQTNESPAGSLAVLVTRVANGPATFGSGVQPNTKKELDKFTGSEVSPSTNWWASASNSWVDLGNSRYYRWNGTAWVTATLATGVASGTTERLFTGGRFPQTKAELDSSAFGQTDAWVDGQFITLGKSVANGGTEKYYWAGATDKWQPGEAPAAPPAP